MAFAAAATASTPSSCTTEGCELRIDDDIPAQGAVTGSSPAGSGLDDATAPAAGDEWNDVSEFKDLIPACAPVWPAVALPRLTALNNAIQVQQS